MPFAKYTNNALDMTRKKTCPIFICKKTGQAQILLVLGVLIQKINGV
jgi:hypothetical protein